MKMNPSIKNIMTPSPITIKDDDSVSTVIQKMKDNDFDHLPVVDKGKNLLGIISKSDLYKKALSFSRNIRKIVYR
ncbi:MAG: CBS domain-containing protein [Saprospiraceae bacterium]|jgi:CBS domain-containing protein